MKIQYVERRFNAQTRPLLDFLVEYIESLSYAVTVRHCYYAALMNSGLVGLTSSRETYIKVQSIVQNGRDAGLIDWDAIVDRSRSCVEYEFYSGPAEARKRCAATYRRDLWLGQECRMLVLVEKDAFVSAIDDMCDRWRMPLYSARGFSSASMLQSIAWNRCRPLIDEGIVPVVLHLGDMDPSGLYATEDLRTRLEFYAQKPVEVVRLGLNLDQCRELPTTFEAKTSDKRFPWYVETTGTTDAWELDAVAGDVVSGWIEDAVLERLDDDGLALWRKQERREAREKRHLEPEGRRRTRG